MRDPKLLPCPFCGGRAGFESAPAGHSVDLQSGVWSVGCMNDKVDCHGYQMLATYARKSEAAKAWNTRMGVGVNPENLAPSISLTLSFHDNAHMVILDPGDGKNYQVNFHYSLKWSPLCTKLVNKRELLMGLQVLAPAGEVLK